LDVVLAVAAEKCTGCRICELACSVRNYGEANPVRARIYVVRDEREGLVGTVPVVCQQCVEPLCVELCPATALSRNDETGAVVVDTDRCLGCRTCVQVCPFGAPSVDRRLGAAEKCDLCDGAPICAEFCPTGALMVVAAEEEAERLRRTRAGAYLDYLRDAARRAGPAEVAPADRDDRGA